MPHGACDDGNSSARRSRWRAAFDHPVAGIGFPSSLLLTANVRTVNAIGVTLPPALLARADGVIE